MRMSIWTHSFVLSFCSLTLLAQEIDPAKTSPRQIPDSPIHNLIQIGPGLYSGAGPETESDFALLKSLGIQTLISVDGTPPRLDEAHRQGLTYRHIPLKYSGIPADAARAIAAAMKQSPGPVFVHCHHGTHRGPSAAAICAISSGLLTNDQAVELLRLAGTGKQYQGLFRDVQNYRPLSPMEEAQRPPVQFVESAPVSSLAESMVEIDSLTDEIKKLFAEKPPSVPADQPPFAVVGTQLQEEFIEAARLLDGPQELKRLLQLSADTAERLAKEHDFTTAKEVFSVMQSQCKACHAEYRDH